MLFSAKKYEQSTDGKYQLFDFIFLKNFNYDFYEVVNIFDEFGIYISDVDRGWIQVYSDINSVFSILLFDTFPIPEDTFNSINFIGSHIFKDFRRIDTNLYHREEDVLYYYEIGIDIRTMKIKRLGKPGEMPCKVRIKMIWHKL